MCVCLCVCEGCGGWGGVLFLKKKNYVVGIHYKHLVEKAGLGGAVGCASHWRPGGRRFDPRRGRQHSFFEIDHEIFSVVILSSADSRRAVVSFWQKNVHNTG